MNEITKQAYSIEEFCELHSISRAKLYLLIKEGTAPTFMRIGKRRLISIEAAEQWRRRMEIDFNQSVEELEINCRCVNALKGDVIYTIGQLITHTEVDLLKRPNIGRKSVNMIKEALKSKKLRLKENE